MQYKRHLQFIKLHMIRYDMMARIKTPYNVVVFVLLIFK